MNVTIDQTKEVHLMDYINIIRKRKLILITCILITLIIVIIGNYTVIPIYQTSCQLIIDRDINISPITGDNIAYSYYETPFSEEKRFNTQANVIASYEVLKEVIKRLNLQTHYAKKDDQDDGFLGGFKESVSQKIRELKGILKGLYKKDEKDEPVYVEDGVDFSSALPDQNISALVLILRNNISIDQLTDTRLITITVKDESPLWAAVIANTLGETYIDYDKSVKQMSFKDFMNWISKEIDDMQQKVDESEQRFLDFKNKEKIYSIKTKQNVVTQRIGDLNDSYIKIETDRMEIRSKIYELENLINRRKDKTLGRDLVDDAMLKDLYQKFMDAQIELDNLSLNYKSKHPMVLNQEKKATLLLDKFNSAIQNSIEGLYLQDSILKSRADAIKSAIAKLEEDAIETNLKEIQYLRIEREVETNKTLHNILLTKSKETRIDESMKKASMNIRFTEPAPIPNSPIRPRKKLNIILGFLFGFMSGVGLVFFLEYMETQIKNEDDVKRYLKLPVLANVPEFTKKLKASQKQHRDETYSLLLQNNEKIPTLFSESFRNLRTNITFSLNNTLNRSILITSSVPQEGKSTTTINLGLTFSQAGNRVLIIDTDLRAPSLNKAFNLNHRKGLTNILFTILDTNINEGTLEEYGIGDIVNLIKIQGKSGVLTISDHTDVFYLSFNEGDLVDIQWQNRPEEERLGNILISCGKITDEQRSRALNHQKYCKQRLGTILLNTNLISCDDIKGPLTLHFSSIINRLLTIKGGFFRFQEDTFFTNELDVFDYLKESFFKWQEYLANQNIPFLRKSISSFIHDTPENHLKILLSGPLPPNPSELLSSKGMRALVNILKRMFDYIILDSPPINTVTDTAILASLTDGVIYIVNSGHTNRHLVLRGKQKLDSLNAKIFGVVLNRLNLKKDGYYYYDKYYHFYPYGDNTTKNSKRKAKKTGRV